MQQTASYLVVDIGKTLSKITAWTADGQLVERKVRPNATCEEDGVRRLDVVGIASWLRQSMREFAHHPIEAIIPVAHGAGVVALRGDDVALAPFDYEASPPPEVMQAYRAQRDPFVETGSPALPDGLNLGAQIFWMERLYPAIMAQATLVPWAQYWAWWLSGVAVSETTSLGCHTDLWNPTHGDFSAMAKRRGWADRFAPVVTAGTVIGTLSCDLARETGLPETAKVLAGIHDSNAALLAARGFAEIEGQEATILSTGTWFVAMRLAATPWPIERLSEARDTLVNIDAYGEAVPSARFMGGREIETVIEIDTRRVDIKPDQHKLLDAVPGLLARGTMLMPTLAPGFGPFPEGPGTWLDRPTEWAGTWYARRAGVCLYAAMVVDAMLDLIGARERILIEGRFAEAEVFVRALAALRPDTAIYVANAHNDVSFGALRLIDPQLRPAGGLRRIEPLAGDIAAYRNRWTRQVTKVAA